MTCWFLTQEMIDVFVRRFVLRSAAAYEASSGTTARFRVTGFPKHLIFYKVEGKEHAISI